MEVRRFKGWAKRQGRGEDVKEDILSAIFTEYMMLLRRRNVALFALSANVQIVITAIILASCEALLRKVEPATR
jgi:hypothetical protein